MNWLFGKSQEKYTYNFTIVKRREQEAVNCERLERTIKRFCNSNQVKIVRLDVFPAGIVSSLTVRCHRNQEYALRSFLISLDNVIKILY